MSPCTDFGESSVKNAARLKRHAIDFSQLRVAGFGRLGPENRQLEGSP
jgi:hypothetical protein